MHIKSITSKRCASITYCNTLLHPAFCPFCLGGNQPAASASARWNFWIREAQLWDHLQRHLEKSCWPLNCPHPLCTLELNDKISFLYHLSDVHSLRTSLQANKCQQKEHDSEPCINWASDTKSQKRKRQGGDEQKTWPSKQNKGHLKIDWGNEQTRRQSLNGKSTHEIQTTSSYTLTEVSFSDMVCDGNPQDLPELSCSGATSPPDVDELSMTNNMSSSENSQQRELHDHQLEWLRKLPETTSDKFMAPLQDEDALFSLYLRSQPSSCSSAKSIGHDNNNNNNNNESIRSHTVALSDICLSVDEDPHLAGLIDQNPVTLENAPIEAKKPHITLRIRQPEPRPKPKVMLRLSQPKLTTPKKSVRQVKPGGNSRRRRQT